MRRRGIGLAAALLAAAMLAAMLGPIPARATPSYSADTGKDCSFCHVTPGGPLTPEGVAFAEQGHSPTPPTTQETTGPETTEAGGSATDEAVGTRGPVLDLPRWARGGLRWLHIVAAIAWFGGMVTVLLVQKPQIALAGIPRGYLMLAWPAIAVVGVSGVILTLGDIGGPGAFTASSWGALLLTKIAIYACLTVGAAIATLLVSPRLQRAAASQGRRTATSQEQYQAQGRMTVRYGGKVYDVTGSRLWPEGRHMKQHDAWQDLTEALTRAPHGPQVLERFTVVEDGGDEPPPLVQRVFLVMVYVNACLMATVVLVVAIW